MKVFGRRDTFTPVAAQALPIEQELVFEGLTQVPDPDPSSRQTTSAPQSQIITMLRDRVLRQIDPTAAADLPFDALRRQLEQIIHAIANEERYEFSGREQALLADELAADMVGNGPLKSLLRDEEVTDIMVNAPDLVYVERHGKLELTNVRFRDTAHIATIAQKIVARIGRRVDK